MLKVVEEFIDVIVGSQRFVVVGASYGDIVRGFVDQRWASIDGLFLYVPVIVADRSERTVPPRTVLVRDESFVSVARSEDMEWLARTGGGPRTVRTRQRSDASSLEE